MVDQAHPSANDDGPGSTDRPFATISAAASRAMPGDTVTVCHGVYRERVAPARGGEPGRPITYAAAEGHRVVLKGSELWSPNWTTLDMDGRWLAAQLPSEFFSPEEKNPFLDVMQGMPEHTCGQLFLDGQPLREARAAEEAERLPGSWRYDPGSREMRVHLPDDGKPIAGRCFEVTTRQMVFAPRVRGLGYIILRGLTVEHAGNNMCAGFWVENNSFPQTGAVSTRSGHHWLIERNTIRYANTAGIACGVEGWYDHDGDDHGCEQFKPYAGHHIIRHNTITENGAGGIIGYVTPHVEITDNVIERNARSGLNHSETAGIKLHEFNHGLIARNLIRDNDAPGIWLDNAWSHARVTRNCILSNAGAGMFIELGDGPLLIDNNVVAYATATMGLAGDGIYSHDASRVTLAHNLLFFNANFGLWAHVATDRDTRGCHDEDEKLETLTACSHWCVRGNLVVGNHHGAISLPVLSDRSQGNECDHNLIAQAYNRITSETYADALDKPVFLVNTNKHRNQIDASALGVKDCSTEDSVAYWAEWPYQNLDQWHRTTEYDAASRVPVLIRPELSSRAMFLKFIIDTSPAEVSPPPTPGVDADYFGRTMPTTPFVGPFQNLRFEPALASGSKNRQCAVPFEAIGNDRMNHLILWPLPQPAPQAVDRSRALPATTTHSISSSTVFSSSM